MLYVQNLCGDVDAKLFRMLREIDGVYFNKSRDLACEVHRMVSPTTMHRSVVETLFENAADAGCSFSICEKDIGPRTPITVLRRGLPLSSHIDIHALFLFCSRCI